MQKYRDDPELMSVMSHASLEDLTILVDIITDNGKGRISLDSTVKETFLQAKEDQVFDLSCKQTIAAEIQKFGGNSLASIFRGGKGVLYKEIVRDVADHVGANYSDQADVAQIEGAIMLKIVERSLDKMSESEKSQFFNQFGVNYQSVGSAANTVAMAALLAVIRTSGFAFYQMATIVAQAAARALLGRGLTFAATGGLMRGLSVLAGPVGWAITGIWSAFDLASPAYRITVPCVIQLGYMRQQALIRECPSCHAPVATDAKFCSECGHKISGEVLLPFRFSNSS